MLEGCVRRLKGVIGRRLSNPRKIDCKEDTSHGEEGKAL